MGNNDAIINPHNVKFADLLHICIKNFGSPRIRGSHHIFKTPWPGDPRINIQKDGNMAKPYQVKMVLKALDKLNVEKGTEESKNGKKHKPEEKDGQK
jgi:hypothetical protein